MNNDAKRRYSVARFVAIVSMLLVFGIVCFYFWVKSTAVWGGVGTLAGYDVRPHQNEVELELRKDLHAWLEHKGFRQASLPDVMVDARGNNWKTDWAKSREEPLVSTAAFQGNDIYVVTWSEKKADVKSWKGKVYYRTVPSDMTWIPGVASGGDSAKALFDDARSFLEQSREQRLGSP